MSWSFSTRLTALEEKRRQLQERGALFPSLLARVLFPSVAGLEGERERALDLSSSLPLPAVEQALQWIYTGREGREAIGLEHLQHLYSCLGEPPQLRRTQVSPLTPSHQPLAPERIETALKRFFQWTSSPAFGELHPIQQLSLVQIRLCEIHPYPRFPETLALLAGCLFLRCAEFPPPSYLPQELAPWYQALDAAFLFQTEPLNQLNLRALERSCDRLAGGL